MTKPHARYQGVTERGATESASPPSPRCNRRRSLEERRKGQGIKGKRQPPGQALLAAPFSIPKTTASKSYARNFFVRPARVCVSVFL